MSNKRYTFLYIPDGSSPSRRFVVPRLMAWSGAVGLVAVVLLAVLYVFGLFQGTSWVPGGSRLQRENRRLASELRRLGDRVALLREDLRDAYRYQQRMALALGLTPLSEAEQAAGVGGRHPLPPQAVNGSSWTPGSLATGALDRDLDTLLRQARLQQQGYRALLDTLSRREEIRGHLPSIRPVDIGWRSSGYGLRHDPFTGRARFHHGLDFSVPVGTPVRATADGVVTALRRERGLGKMVRIDHGNGLTTTYAHLSRWLVRKGEHVRRGQVIAESGNSGRSTAPHLHYEVRRQGRSVDPSPYILDRYAGR